MNIGCYMERFPSGQREQTVNLPALRLRRFESSPLHRRGGGSCAPCRNNKVFCAGVAQLARASAFQAEGRGFESRFPLHCESGAHVAQSVEHFLGKEEATGSSPVVGSFKPGFYMFFEQTKNKRNLIKQ